MSKQDYKKHGVSKHILVCTKCGNSYPFMRVNQRFRGKNHLKPNWCIICKKRTLHREKF